MFELTDFSGQPLTRDYAERRARWDVLQEIVQTKGNSETHPGISPNDEFAGDLGVAGWEYGNLTLTDKPLSREMMPTNYLRAGLLRGLEQEAKLGVNPFKFGIVGSTDVHNSLTAIEEDNFFGKMPYQEPSPTRWEHVSKEGFGKTRYTWHYLAAGYAAVWATENTREALWDAMQRKEVYGTSGTRMTVRFFGGWDYQRGRRAQPQRRRRRLRERRADGRRPHEGARGQGADVPGGCLQGPDVRQPRPHPDRQGLARQGRQGAGARLRRGVGRRGATQARQGRQAARRSATRSTSRPRPGRTRSATRNCRPCGRTRTSIPTLRAFYYARVIEIPTPRWTAYDQVRFDIKMSPEVPMTQQERGLDLADLVHALVTTNGMRLHEY